MSWDHFRRWVFDDPALAFRLDVSRMDMPESYWDRLAPAMSDALVAMAELESGSIANPDEQRMVGHYWLRAAELAPTSEIATSIRQTREALTRFADRVHSEGVRPERSERFETVLVVGIGGSALGPQLISDALGGRADRMQARFLDNTDPDGIDRVLGALDPSRTLTIVISKSGGTPETRNGMLETAGAYTRAGLDFGAHAVAITQVGSRLDDHARDAGFLARFPMWDWVGGRTSVTSAVGLLPAALQGIDVNGLLSGAAAMDRVTRNQAARENPAALLAAAWHHAGQGRGSRDMVILPYKDRLALFSRYLQQLVMESLGKERDLRGAVVHQGIAVYGNKGSTDQHAYVQQLRDGLSNFFATFLHVQKDRDEPGLEVEPGITAGDFLHGFLLGTRRALHENARPSLTLSVPDVSPHSLGMLIALYERTVGLYASLIGVNAYHQPGVEAGKRAAADVLEMQRRLMAALSESGPSGADCEVLARRIGRPDEVETIFWLLERLSANPGRGVRRVAGSTAFDATYHAESV